MAFEGAMKSTVEDRVDLTGLAHRLRSVAEALKHLSAADQSQISKKIDVLRGEMNAIAAKLKNKL